MQECYPLFIQQAYWIHNLRVFTVWAKYPYITRGVLVGFHYSSVPYTGVVTPSRWGMARSIIETSSSDESLSGEEGGSGAFCSSRAGAPSFSSRSRSNLFSSVSSKLGRGESGIDLPDSLHFSRFLLQCCLLIHGKIPPYPFYLPHLDCGQ